MALINEKVMILCEWNYYVYRAFPNAREHLAITGLSSLARETECEYIEHKQLQNRRYCMQIHPRYWIPPLVVWYLYSLDFKQGTKFDRTLFSALKRCRPFSYLHHINRKKVHLYCSHGRKSWHLRGLQCLQVCGQAHR